MKIKEDSSLLIDMQYVKANRQNNTPDYLYMIYRDLDTDEKKLQIVPEPKMDIYFTKPEFRNHSYNKNYELMSRLNKKIVRARDIIYEIANDQGDVGRQRLNDCFNTRNYKGLQEFYLYPYVYGADYDVRVWYRNKWLDKFDTSRPKVLKKGFLDIEVDTYESVGMPNPQQNPIDLVTFIDDSAKQVYTFCLLGVECQEKSLEFLTPREREMELKRRELYENRKRLQQAVVDDIPGLKERIHKEFDEKYPGFNYNLYFYKDERKMLVHLFQLINKLKLDFIGVWNIEFDIPYIYDRLVALGLDPKEVMCHPDFPVKECWFKKDTRNFAVKNKSSFFHCSSYTVFYDQMIVYAAIRKGQKELRSNRLTYIGKVELNDEKLDYSETGNLKTLSYKDYITYILYNIKDVLLQSGIEAKTSDVDTFYIYSYKNITPYESVFKQTVKLRNVQYRTFAQQEIVPGSNINTFLFNNAKEEEDEDDDEDDKFEGALVGNPLLNDEFGMEMFGHVTNNVFRFSIDMDMSSFYPSTISAMNIDASTLIFKMILDSSQYDIRGGVIPFHGITDTQVVSTNSDSFSGDVAKEVMDNFQTRDWISTGHKWMNLPSVNKVYKRLVKELGAVA